MVSVSGQWDSDYGSMIWTENGASYGKADGEISGAFDGQVFTGYWVEARSDNPCATSYKGSESWGRIELTFDANFEFFQGQWSYCNIEPVTPWTGMRSLSDTQAINDEQKAPKQ